MAWYDSFKKSSWMDWLNPEDEAGRENSYAGHATDFAGETRGVSDIDWESWTNTASDYLGKAQKAINAYDSMQPEQPEITGVEQPAQASMPTSNIQFPTIEQSLNANQPPISSPGMPGAGLMESFQGTLDQGDYKILSANRDKLYAMLGNYRG